MCPLCSVLLLAFMPFSRKFLGFHYKAFDSQILVSLLICIPLLLGRSEFIFINPNSKGQCGCGESFMTAADGSTAKQSGSR